MKIFMRTILLKKHFCLFSFLLFAVVCSYAQQITLPYVCSFEEDEAAEISNWVLNAGPDGVNCNDQWMVGNLEHNDGHQSLYISCDSGITAKYGAKKNLVVAYRILEFSEKVTVDITFDYKLYGAENTSMLYVGLVNEALPINSNSTDATLSTTYKSQLRNQFYQSITWSTFTLQNQSIPANRKVKLIFVWENYNTDTTIINPMAPCIDNIQITKSNCKMPSNLSMESECGSFTATWDGTSDFYEFQYRKTGNQNWTTQKITETSITIGDIDEGQWDMRVRGVCILDGVEHKSAYLSLNSAICFCADNHCINYVDLYGEHVVCQTGTVSGGFSTGSDITSNVVNFGPNNPSSRHTVYWEKGQYDPLTGGKLQTIPDGEFASVRLGNWLKGAESERITYEYYVDPNSDVILLMKYAIVLEKPDGSHVPPAFEFKILDQNGKPISSCVEANFTPYDEYIEWEVYRPDYKTGYGEIVWKDWSSIGVDLRNYKGQTIKVQLSTQDCELTAHCGYAYFTLGCIDAAIKSTSCGDDIKIDLSAPDGFKYTWYHFDENNKEIFDSNEKTLWVPSNDTATYYCKIDYLDQEGCDFTLHTEVKPRIPFADFTYEWIPNDCKNQVRFTSNSHVLTRIDGKEVPNGEKVENHYWIINGEVVSELGTFVYDVDSLGAEFDLELLVGISDNQCMDTIVKKIVVDPIYSERIVIDTTLCDGDYIELPNFGVFFADTVAVNVEKSDWCGCDSTTVLILDIVEQPEDTHVDTTICANDVFIFEATGEEVTESKTFRLLSSFGCDSVVVINIERILPINAHISDEYRFLCADDSILRIPYEVTGEERAPYQYSIVFDNFAKDCGFVDQSNTTNGQQYFTIEIPNNCRPNTYTANIVLEDTSNICGDVSIPVTFDVYYSSSILEPKFNNLITILDADHNGGYEFEDNSYQWYKNGEKIEGANLAFLYLPDGEVFGDECYYLEVKRSDDGVVMSTCEICPNVGTPVEDVAFEQAFLYNTLMYSNQDIRLYNVDRGYVNIYTLTGQILHSYYVSSSDTNIKAPSESGIYLLQVIAPTGTQIYKIKVK